MKKFLLPLLLSCLATTGRSQDSLLHVIREFITQDSLIREETRFSREGILMPVRGIVQTFTHRSFNNLPGPYRQNNHRWEDYGIALTPLAATWVMKAFGVESRSTTRRMLTANASALALTVGLSQTLRWSVTEERPDGLGRSSLPSFHSALAFMGATVLSREYGHISPWITIGGYTAATGTQLLRIRHNAHWMNDIALGAGIGVVSTNLAYYITDKIIGKKGIRPMPLSPSEQAQLIAWAHRPTGFRLISGTETNGRDTDLADIATAAPGLDLTDARLRCSASLTAGIQADCYITDNLYLSAICRYTHSQAKLQIPSASLRAWGEQVHLYHGNLAAGWALPLLPMAGGGNVRFALQTLWGARYNEGITFRQVAPGRQLGPEILYIKPQLRPTGGAGIAIDMLQSHNQTVGFSIDYLHTFGTRLLANRWIIASSWKAMF